MELPRPRSWCELYSLKVTRDLPIVLLSSSRNPARIASKCRSIRPPNSMLPITTSQEYKRAPVNTTKSDCLERKS